MIPTKFASQLPKAIASVKHNLLNLPFSELPRRSYFVTFLNNSILDLIFIVSQLFKMYLRIRELFYLLILQ